MNKVKMKKGFSIIETLVAITIVSIVLAGFSMVVATSYDGHRQAKRSYVAAAIAGEGMEMVAAKVKNNKRCLDNPGGCTLAPGNWKANLTGGTGSFRVDINEVSELWPGNAWDEYNTSNPERLCIVDNGTYGYCGEDPDKVIAGDYTREVEIESINSDIIKARVTVSWTSASGNRTNVILENRFYRGHD